jgi:hypothetical protein
MAAAHFGRHEFPNWASKKLAVAKGCTAVRMLTISFSTVSP